MSARALWLLMLLCGWASPALAGEPQPGPSPEPLQQAVPVKTPKEMQGWAAGLSKHLAQVTASVRFKRARGVRVKLSFTVTEDGQITGVRAEGEPQAVERVVAAVRKIGNVPTPPDHKAHPIEVPIRFN